MAGKFLRIGKQSYAFKRYITEDQMLEFKNHIGAYSYHFKKARGGYALYVTTQSGCSYQAISKYHPNYNIMTK